MEMFWAGGMVLASILAARAEEVPLFAFPLDCVVGKSCFLQNLVDLDQESAAIADTLCGQDTYDNHKGIDIRVFSLADVARGVDVFAVADGEVLGVRDEVADRLVDSPEALATIKGRECGNGVALRHENGLATQYCHMKLGSIAVAKGQRVRRGDILGKVGVSGLSAFPHLHLTVRSGDMLVDALTGTPAEAKNCSPAKAANGPFGRETTEALIASRDDILQIGLAGKPFDIADLVEGRVPPLPTAQSEAVVAWGWAINAHQGDRMRIRIETGEGVFSDNMSKPLANRKAATFNFAGRNRPPKPGPYKVTVSLLRSGQVIEKKSETFIVR